MSEDESRCDDDDGWLMDQRLVEGCKRLNYIEMKMVVVSITRCHDR